MGLSQQVQLAAGLHKPAHSWRACTSLHRAYHTHALLTHLR